MIKRKCVGCGYAIRPDARYMVTYPRALAPGEQIAESECGLWHANCRVTYLRWNGDSPITPTVPAAR